MLQEGSNKKKVMDPDPLGLESTEPSGSSSLYREFLASIDFYNVLSDVDSVPDSPVILNGDKNVFLLFDVFIAFLCPEPSAFSFYLLIYNSQKV